MGEERVLSGGEEDLRRLGLASLSIGKPGLVSREAAGAVTGEITNSVRHC